MDAVELSIVLPALCAGLLIAATHVPLGMQVLDRGIVFIDIAIAQIAGVGVVAADYFGVAEGDAFAVEAAALGAALLGAGFLTWTDRRCPEVQEALIGTVFVLAATAQILLLANHPHGGEFLKELLVGQILWVTPVQLGAAAAISAVVLTLWFGAGRARLGRLGFYALFGLAVTASVQLVGVYLVFATLIVPALASRSARRWRLAVAYGVAAAGFVAGLVASVALDLPTGPLTVWALAVVGVASAWCMGAVANRD